MRRITLALAGLIASGLASLASAADLPLPPAPVLEPAPPVDFGSWYIRGDIGAGFAQINSLTTSFNPNVVVPDARFDHKSVTDSFIFGGGVGYQFNSWFRADITGEWRDKQGYRASESWRDDFAIGCPGGRCTDTYYGKVVNSGTYMANGYFDLGTWSGFTPYVGAGIGTANLRFGRIQDIGLLPANGYGVGVVSSKWNFAWALMAGFSYTITPNLLVDVGYRYIDQGSITGRPIICSHAGACPQEQQRLHLASNDVRIGLRYLFGAPVPIEPPPAPIVRKY